MRVRGMAAVLAIALLAASAMGTQVLAVEKARVVLVGSGSELVKKGVISGAIHVWLRVSDATGWTATVIYRDTGSVLGPGALQPEINDSFPGWYFYWTSLATIYSGTATVTIYDSSGKKVGSDSFLAGAIP